MSTRTTFTLDEHLVADARRLEVNISAAAREGVAAAVRRALAESDRAADQQNPERVTEWEDVEAWGDQ